MCVSIYVHLVYTHVHIYTSEALGVWGFRVWGRGFRVYNTSEGFGFRVQGFGVIF